MQILFFKTANSCLIGRWRSMSTQQGYPKRKTIDCLSPNRSKVIECTSPRVTSESIQKTQTNLQQSLLNEEGNSKQNALVPLDNQQSVLLSPSRDTTLLQCSRPQSPSQKIQQGFQYFPSSSYQNVRSQQAYFQRSQQQANDSLKLPFDIIGLTAKKQDISRPQLKLASVHQQFKEKGTLNKLPRNIHYSVEKNWKNAEEKKIDAQNQIQYDSSCGMKIRSFYLPEEEFQLPYFKHGYKTVTSTTSTSHYSELLSFCHRNQAHLNSTQNAENSNNDIQLKPISEKINTLETNAQDRNERCQKSFYDGKGAKSEGIKKVNNLSEKIQEQTLNQQISPPSHAASTQNMITPIHTIPSLMKYNNSQFQSPRQALTANYLLRRKKVQNVIPIGVSGLTAAALETQNEKNGNEQAGKIGTTNFSNKNLNATSTSFKIISGIGNNTSSIVEDLSLINKNAIDIKSKSVAIFDLDSQKFVLSVKGSKPHEIASLTKIMVCYIICDLMYRNLFKKSDPVKINFKSNLLIKVSKVAATMIGTSAFLRRGDELTLWSLLHGLMLPSGNDAAFTISEKIGSIMFENTDEFQQKNFTSPGAQGCHPKDGQKEFIRIMNLYAEKMKLKNTHFSNAHGLSNNKNKSSANDICLVISQAMKNPLFNQIVSCKQYSANVSNQKLGTRIILWENTNKLLHQLQNCLGIKTGVTPTAGPCLATAFNLGQRKFAIVVLKSPSMEERFVETITLLKWVVKELKLEYDENQLKYLSNKESIIEENFLKEGKESWEQSNKDGYYGLSSKNCLNVSSGSSCESEEQEDEEEDKNLKKQEDLFNKSKCFGSKKEKIIRIESQQIPSFTRIIKN